MCQVYSRFHKADLISTLILNTKFIDYTRGCFVKCNAGAQFGLLTLL